MSKVFISTPSDGTVVFEILGSILDMNNDRHGHELHFDSQVGFDTTVNKNNLTKNALARGADYVLFLDSDNPPVGNPIELVDGDYDIIGCPTPIFTSKQLGEGCFPLGWNVRAKPDGGPLGYRGVEEVGFVGSGCLLVARRVLEALKPVWLNKVDDDGILVSGDDINLCRRAWEAGFKVHVSWDHVCRHKRRADLLEMLLAFESLPGPRAPAPVIVTGTGRSGTSAVAQALHIMGISMGAKFNKADESNPQGDWEDQEFVTTNDMLATNREHLNDMRRRIIFLTAKRRRTQRPWGFKDPTTSLCLPLYQELIPDAKWVVVRRKQAAVNKSMQKTYGWTEEFAQAEIDRRWEQIKTHLEIEDPTYVQYEYLLRDPKAALLQLTRALGVKISAPTLLRAAESIKG